MVDLADLARLTPIDPDSEETKSLLEADKFAPRFQLLLNERMTIEKAVMDSVPHAELIRAARPVIEYVNQNTYNIREAIRQTQLFQSYWVDWSYIPSHEKIKFLIRLNKLSNNITPALSITEIVLLWFQDFEDKKKRLKKAGKLIKLVLGCELPARYYSKELHIEPFDKQVKTIIAIDDFERCAFDGLISRSAPEFASYWRANLKTQLVLPVQAEKKTYENAKARTLLLACLENYNGTPPNYKTLLTHALSNAPQGYEDLKLIDHAEFSMKKLAWNGGSIYLKQFSKAFANEKNQFRPI